MAEKLDNLYLRQLDFIDKDKFDTPICIVGAGATGSFVALFLAKMGMNNIRLWDFDSVEEHNFPNQMFRMEDLNGLKSQKTADIVRSFTGTRIKYSVNEYKRQPLEGIVISAVDSMKMRKQIYENCIKQGKTKLIVDPRTAGETFRLYTVNMEIESERKFYEKYFYSDKNTTPIPCTAQAIIYNVGIVSGFVCNQVKRYLMNEDIKKEVIADTGNCFYLTK